VSVGLTGWKELDDLLHFLFEPNLQYPIRLVNDQGFKILENETLRILRPIRTF
jgi:hypothetical protein